MDLAALWKMSYGVYIVSSMNGAQPTGCVANSAMQVTNEPNVIAVSINHANFTNRCIKESGMLSLSILSEATNPALIGTFGFHSGSDTAKYRDVDFFYSQGMPVVKDACAYVVAKVLSHVELSTHTVFFAELIEAQNLECSAPPMTYAYYHKVIKGKSPKNAPTYIPETPKEEAPKGKVYVCSVCGYEYDASQVPFEELPEDWVCPICGVGKEMFEEK